MMCSHGPCLFTAAESLRMVVCLFIADLLFFLAFLLFFLEKRRERRFLSSRDLGVAYNSHKGQIVHILRPMRECSEPMFLVRAQDGCELFALPDELSDPGELAIIGQCHLCTYDVYETFDVSVHGHLYHRDCAESIFPSTDNQDPGIPKPGM